MINKYYNSPDDLYTGLSKQQYDDGDYDMMDPTANVSPHIMKRLRSSQMDMDNDLIRLYGFVSPVDNIMADNLNSAISRGITQDFNIYMSQRPQQDPYYTIRKNLTLSQIAADHGMTYQELAKLNGITNPNLIRAGLRLRFNDNIANVYRDIKRRRNNILPITTPSKPLKNINRYSNTRPVINHSTYQSNNGTQSYNVYRPTNNTTTPSKPLKTVRFNQQIKPIKHVTDYRDVYEKPRKSYFNYKKGELPNGAYRKYKTGIKEGTLLKNLTYEAFLRKYNYPDNYAKRTVIDEEKNDLFMKMARSIIRFNPNFDRNE